MPDPAQTFATATATAPPGGPDRPLAGITLLAVEDSRYASEAIRLVCQRSGARLRRADCIASAWRHLRCYRPDVLAVDLGLPDGSGIDLIAALSQAPLRPRAILAISGQPDAGPKAIEAGADAFLEKPIASVAAFQSLVLRLIATGPTALAEAAQSDLPVEPDPIALRDDLAQAARMLADHPDADARRYIAGFLAGVAVSAHDPALARAAGGLAPQDCHSRPVPPGEAVNRLSQLVRHRLTIATGGPLGTVTPLSGFAGSAPRRI